MAEPQLEVENPTLGKLKLTGPIVLTLLCTFSAAASGFGVYLLFEQKSYAKERDSALVQALGKFADAQERMVTAQREQNCLIALPQDRREKEFLSDNSFCKRLSR